MPEEGEGCYFIVGESEDGERGYVINFFRNSFNQVVGKSYFFEAAKVEGKLGDEIVAKI